MLNERVMTNLLRITLPDRSMVRLTHLCDIVLLGLPQVLIGHIIPTLSVVSLMGIRALCNARCTVVFDKTKCYIICAGHCILHVCKDPASNLWALTLGDPSHVHPLVIGNMFSPWLGNPFLIPQNFAIILILDLLNSGIFIGILIF